MIKELLYKLFGLEPFPCQTCEVLRIQLDESNRERKELLHKLLAKDIPEQLPTDKEEFQPILPQHLPWRVRQQILEAEDRQKAHLMREKQREIDSLKKPVTTVEALEAELDIAHDVSGPSGGVQFDASKVS